MNKIKTLLITVLAFSQLSFGQTPVKTTTPARDVRLWYTQPAATHQDALMLSNGKNLAMLTGTVATERISLFDASLWTGSGSSLNTSLLGMPFRNVGDINLTFASQTPFTAYTRELDLQTGISTVRYTVKGVVFTRTYVASLSDSVVLIHLKASKPGSITLKFALSSLLPQSRVSTEDDKLILSTAVTPVRCSMQVKPFVKKGICSVTNNTYYIQKADEVTLIVSIATNLSSDGKPTQNELDQCRRNLNRAYGKEFEPLRQNHIQRYQRLFNEFTFQLEPQAPVKKATDKRLQEFKPGTDAQFAELYVAYGRYLQLFTTNPTGYPILYGKTLSKAFDCSNSLDSLLKLGSGLTMPRWPTDFFAGNSANAPLVEAWQTAAIWNAYRNTSNEGLLRENANLLKASARAWMNVVKPGAWNPTLQTSFAPIASQVLSSVSSANEVLNAGLKSLFSRSDKPFTDSLSRMVASLPALQVSDNGNPQISGSLSSDNLLFALYPGSMVSPYKTFPLFTAFKNYLGTLSAASDPYLWAAGGWARLLSGNKALERIQSLWTPVTVKNPRGTTFSNLLDATSNYKTEKCMSVVPIVAEMMLQSYDGTVFLLPALPTSWKNGSVTGLPATGGYLFDINWKNGQVETVRIRAKNDGLCRIRSATPLTSKALKQLKAEILPAAQSNALPVTYLYEIKMQAGEQAVLKKVP